MFRSSPKKFYRSSNQTAALYATGGAAFSRAIFDGASPNVTLDTNKLIVTRSGTATYSGSRSLAMLSSGKYYFELTCNSRSGTFDLCGIIAEDKNFFDIIQNGKGGGLCYLFSGNIFANDANSGSSLGAVSNTTTVGIAVDLDNDLIWFKALPSGNWNGSGTADPATGVGGISISNYSAKRVSPCVGFGGTSGASGDNLTANFGATAFSGSVPSGFGGWPARTGGAEWLTALDVSEYGSGSNVGSWNGFTMREWLIAGMVGHVGTKMRITLAGGTVEGAKIDALYVGPAAASGDAYDFDGTQTQILFSGASGADTGVGGTILSDEMVLTNDPSKNFICSMHFNDATKDTLKSVSVSGGSAKCAAYWKSISEASTTNATTGYSQTAATINLISKIEVWG